MNSLERVCATVRRCEPDVMPVGPFMGNYGAIVGGASILNYCTNGRIMAEAQMRAWEIFQQDIIIAQSDNYYIAQGFGVEVEFWENSTPTLKKPAIDDLRDISQLRIPDPQNDGRMPVYLEAIQRLFDQVGNKVAIRGTGTGPFSLAGHVLGTEKFLMELAMAQMDPEGDGVKYLKQLMAKTSEALLLFLLAEVETGANILHIGDSLASTDVISPAMYKEWVYPYEKWIIDQLKQKKGNQDKLFTLLHICGNTTQILDLMADTGADILEIDYKVNMSVAKELVGDRVCLIGNLNPSAVLLQGTPEIVEQEALHCIEAAASGGGFILGSGCELAYLTPSENVNRMVQVAHNYRYR